MGQPEPRYVIFVSGHEGLITAEEADENLSQYRLLFDITARSLPESSGQVNIVTVKSADDFEKTFQSIRVRSNRVTVVFWSKSWIDFAEQLKARYQNSSVRVFVLSGDIERTRVIVADKRWAYKREFMLHALLEKC